MPRSTSRTSDIRGSDDHWWSDDLFLSIFYEFGILPDSAIPQRCKVHQWPLEAIDFTRQMELVIWFLFPIGVFFLVSFFWWASDTPILTWLLLSYPFSFGYFWRYLLRWVPVTRILFDIFILHLHFFISLINTMCFSVPSSSWRDKNLKSIDMPILAYPELRFLYTGNTSNQFYELPPTTRHLKIRHPPVVVSYRWTRAGPSQAGNRPRSRPIFFSPRRFLSHLRTHFSTLQSPTFAILRLVRARLHSCFAL